MNKTNDELEIVHPGIENKPSQDGQVVYPATSKLVIPEMKDLNGVLKKVEFITPTTPKAFYYIDELAPSYPLDPCLSLEEGTKLPPFVGAGIPKTSPHTPPTPSLSYSDLKKKYLALKAKKKIENLKKKAWDHAAGDHTNNMPTKATPLLSWGTTSSAASASEETDSELGVAQHHQGFIADSPANIYSGGEIPPSQPTWKINPISASTPAYPAIPEGILGSSYYTATPTPPSIPYKSIMWTHDNAKPIIDMLQQTSRAFGYHLCLGGGVLNEGKSYKDLDLYYLPLDNQQNKPAPYNLLGYLMSITLNTLRSISNEEKSSSYGSSCGAPYIAKLKGFWDGQQNKRIDFFILGSNKDLKHVNKWYFDNAGVVGGLCVQIDVEPTHIQHYKKGQMKESPTTAASSPSISSECHNLMNMIPHDLGGKSKLYEEDAVHQDGSCESNSSYTVDKIKTAAAETKVITTHVDDVPF